MSKEFKEILSCTLGTAGAFFGSAGGFGNVLLHALPIMMGVDWITGLLAAAVNRKINSSVGFRGICRKGGMLCVVAAAALCDRILPGNGEALRTAVTVFYIANEGLSMLENVCLMGIPVPEKLRALLEKSREENNE